MRLLNIILGLFDRGKRLATLAHKISELESRKVETITKYIEVNHYEDDDKTYIRELATIGMNEYFRFFLFSLKDSLSEQLASLPSDQVETRAAMVGGLKELSLIQKKIELAINQYAEQVRNPQ